MPDPGVSENYQAPVDREADARTEIADFENQTQASNPAQWVYVDDYVKDRPVDLNKVRFIRDANGVDVPLKAPELTEAEYRDAAVALQGVLDAGQAKYPVLANYLLKNPEQLWVLAEIQMMLSPEPNDVSYDITADLMEGLTTTEGQRTEYEYRTAHEETQQLFWEEAGRHYAPAERDYFISAFAQLSPEGANRVGAQALAWLDTYGSDIDSDEEMKGQLFLNIINWQAKEQEYEGGQRGFLGVLDFAQEQVEHFVVSPLINAGVGLLSGPEEAARRRDLSVGQQIAYQLGMKPPEEAGGFGWWSFVSGLSDAVVEIGADPLSWLAGLGAGVKAIKTIPMAADVTRAGRLAASARALLPKPFAGYAKAASGGRLSRVLYALNSHTVDELLNTAVRNGVVGDALELIQKGNISKFNRLFPAWKNLSDDAIRVIQETVQTPEELVGVLKSAALDDLRRSGQTLDNLTKKAKASRDALRKLVGKGQTDEIAQEILDHPERFAFHGTLQIDDAKAAELLAGEDSFYRGGLANNRLRGEAYAPPVDVARPSGKDNIINRVGRKVLVFRIDDMGPRAQNMLKRGDIEEWQSIFKTAEDVKTIKPVHIYDVERGLGTESATKTFGELIGDANLPRDLRLQAAKDKLALDSWNLKANKIFLLSEVPLKPKKIFSWQKILDIKGTGRLATGVRRVAARSSLGRIPSTIHLQKVSQGVDDIRRIGEHFGVAQDVLDNLVQEFRLLEPGARQEWVWDTFLRRVGRETGVPAFEHELIQFYKGSGIRNFSGSGVDLIEQGKRIPLLPTQQAAEMPVPVDILDQVFKRARSIGERSDIARRLGFNGRGLGATADRRTKLMRSLRKKLGEAAEGMSNDQLYDMAYSVVAPNSGLDGRGIAMGKLLPWAGSAMDQFHSYFTKSMLVFRPIQWMWRVALLEEPIRAHIYNLPSFYDNPLQYMARARAAHYISNVEKWAQSNMSWAQDVLGTLAKGGREDILKRVTDLGMVDDIFGGDIPRTVRGVRNAVEQFVENAVYGRTHINRLSPIKRVPWSVKNKAHSIKTAENALAKLNMPIDFRFEDDAQEIVGRLVSGYLGDAVGATERKLYQWTPGLGPDEAYMHGRVWGSNLVQMVEDPWGRAGLRRRAALLRGEAPDITGHDLINSSHWSSMAPDLRVKYADKANDFEVAEAYLDDMLGQEIDHLFKPFGETLTADEMADLLDEFATSRRITGNIDGVDIDWDLRSANYGGGIQDVGNTVRDLRQTQAVTIPSNLPSPSFDPRFMAEDNKPGVLKKLADGTMQLFGEKATQTINRRPAYLTAYQRHYDKYVAMGVPIEHAQMLAKDDAARMVNWVYFNMDEAPYYVAKLNKYLPFFGATYEVLNQWTYRMPVAVGGSWPMGVGEFARKFDRLIDGLVNIGLLDRETEDDGSTSIVLNLVPPDNDMRDNNEVGSFLQGAGYAAVHALDSAVSTILGMEAGLEIREQGYRFAVGHPLNLSDYGILSFAQKDIGLNPVTNIAVSQLAARIPGASGPRREPVPMGESIAATAARLNVDIDDLIRYNREMLVDTEGLGNVVYEGLLTGELDPNQVSFPENTSVNIPGSSLWDAISDTFMPFGEITNPREFGANFVPGALRWVFAGMGIANQPTDEFWKDSDMDGLYGGVLPSVNQAQGASQINEAFMFMEAHDLVNGKSPFERIQEKEQQLSVLLKEGKTDEANELRAVVQQDINAMLDRVQKIASESLIMRGLTGSFLPTTPGHVRLEQEKIRDFWDTKDYMDSITSGEGEMRLRNFKTIEEWENRQEQLGAWLSDPTGDRARAIFYQNNPQLMAYLTPKTFYKGDIPEIKDYEEFQRQLESGERQSSPLHITMWRARSAAIQADYHNKYIASFGNDPMEAAAIALQNRSMLDELKDERDLAYQGLEMWDDMHGGVYANFRKENYQDEENWAQDQIRDKLNKVRDNLDVLYELDDNLDIELDLTSIQNLNDTIKGVKANISAAIEEYNELSDRTITRNPYEAAVHRYFQEVYIPHADKMTALYEKIPEVADSERASLIYEQIKFEKNEIAGHEVYLSGSSIPFPNPLEFSWQGKSDEERQIKIQQWLTRPAAWMDLDQAIRILEQAPQLQGYIPTSLADFDIYRQYTLQKLKYDEMFEANEITRSDLTKINDRLKEQLALALNQQGRGNELRFADMTPYEKLQISGFLPKPLEYLSDKVGYTKQALAAADETPGTVQGRKITQSLLNLTEQAYYSDPLMRDTILNLGINLKDETNLDLFLNYLFFDYTGER